jgi:hypothetical protein
MKSRGRKCLFGLGALALLSLLVWSGFRADSTPRLTVMLVGVENDPISHPPDGPTVLHGGRGLCAVFAVTNISKQDAIWFNTCAVEHKVGLEWRRTLVPSYLSRVLSEKPWLLIDSDDVNDVYPPGRAWYYVVPWPPNIPTNATWRLQLRYGRTPSAFTKKMSSAFDFTGKLGSTLFNKRRAEGTLLTPEVRH